MIQSFAISLLCEIMVESSSGAVVAVRIRVASIGRGSISVNLVARGSVAGASGIGCTSLWGSLTI